MRRNHFACLLAAATLLAASCGGDDDTADKPAVTDDAPAPTSDTDDDGGGAGGNPGPGVTDDSITIGGWFPLSGPVATFGVSLVAGIEAYVESLNAQDGVNGRMINYIAEDNAFDPQRTITIARKLIEQDDVFAIVCPNGTGQTEAAFPYVLDDQQVPIFGTYGGLPSWYEPPRENLFAAQTPYIPDATSLTARWVVEQDGHSSVVNIIDEIAAFNEQSDAFNASVAELGGSSEKITVPNGIADWSPVVTDLVNQDPDAVVLFVTIPEAVGYLKEADRQGFDAEVYVHVTGVDQSLIQLAGDLANGVKGPGLTAPPDLEGATGALAEFQEAMSVYSPDADVNQIAQFGYACMDVFVQALATTDGVPNHASLTEALYAMDGYQSLLGPITFSPDQHDGAHALMPQQVQDGAWTPIDEFIQTDGEE